MNYPQNYPNRPPVQNNQQNRGNQQERRPVYFPFIPMAPFCPQIPLQNGPSPMNPHIGVNAHIGVSPQIPQSNNQENQRRPPFIIHENPNINQNDAIRGLQTKIFNLQNFNRHNQQCLLHSYMALDHIAFQRNYLKSLCQGLISERNKLVQINQSLTTVNSIYNLPICPPPLRQTIQAILNQKENQKKREGILYLRTDVQKQGNSFLQKQQKYSQFLAHQQNIIQKNLKQNFAERKQKQNPQLPRQNSQLSKQNPQIAKQNQRLARIPDIYHSNAQNNQEIQKSQLIQQQRNQQYQIEQQKNSEKVFIEQQSPLKKYNQKQEQFKYYHRYSKSGNQPKQYKKKLRDRERKIYNKTTQFNLQPKADKLEQSEKSIKYQKSDRIRKYKDINETIAIGNKQFSIFNNNELVINNINENKELKNQKDLNRKNKNKPNFQYLQLDMPPKAKRKYNTKYSKINANMQLSLDKDKYFSNVNIQNYNKQHEQEKLGKAQQSGEQKSDIENNQNKKGLQQDSQRVNKQYQKQQKQQIEQERQYVKQDKQGQQDRDINYDYLKELYASKQKFNKNKRQNKDNQKQNKDIAQQIKDYEKQKIKGKNIDGYKKRKYTKKIKINKEFMSDDNQSLIQEQGKIDLSCIPKNSILKPLLQQQEKVINKLIQQRNDQKPSNIGLEFRKIESDIKNQVHEAMQQNIKGDLNQGSQNKIKLKQKNKMIQQPFQKDLNLNEKQNKLDKEKQQYQINQREAKQILKKIKITKKKISLGSNTKNYEESQLQEGQIKDPSENKIQSQKQLSKEKIQFQNNTNLLQKNRQHSQLYKSDNHEQLYKVQQAPKNQQINRNILVPIQQQPQKKQAKIQSKFISKQLLHESQKENTQKLPENIKQLISESDQGQEPQEQSRTKTIVNQKINCKQNKKIKIDSSNRKQEQGQNEQISKQNQKKAQEKIQLKLPARKISQMMFSQKIQQQDSEKIQISHKDQIREVNSQNQQLILDPMQEKELAFDFFNYQQNDFLNPNGYIINQGQNNSSSLSQIQLLPISNHNQHQNQSQALRKKQKQKVNQKQNYPNNFLRKIKILKEKKIKIIPNFQSKVVNKEVVNEEEKQLEKENQGDAQSSPKQLPYRAKRGRKSKKIIVHYDKEIEQQRLSKIQQKKIKKKIMKLKIECQRKDQFLVIKNFRQYQRQTNYGVIFQQAYRQSIQLLDKQKYDKQFSYRMTEDKKIKKQRKKYQKRNKNQCIVAAQQEREAEEKANLEKEKSEQKNRQESKQVSRQGSRQKSNGKNKQKNKQKKNRKKKIKEKIVKKEGKKEKMRIESSMDKSGVEIEQQAQAGDQIENSESMEYNIDNQVKQTKMNVIQY